MSESIDRESCYLVRMRRPHYIRREEHPDRRLRKVYARKKILGFINKRKESYSITRLH